MSEDELDQLRSKRRAELEERLKGPSVPESPVHVTDQAHFADQVETYRLALVDFHAEWCGPCKMLEPIIDRIAAVDEVAVLKVDIDQHQQLAAEHGVRGVPTLVLYVAGEPTERLVGMQDESTLLNLIDRYRE